MFTVFCTTRGCLSSPSPVFDVNGASADRVSVHYLPVMFRGSVALAIMRKPETAIGAILLIMRLSEFLGVRSNGEQFRFSSAIMAI